ncbi:murein hydrolase activator NlpD [Candidatus Profftia tarda]|nr:murein hydrolase activator NlpD [Candidatus Profftia tarda]
MVIQVINWLQAIMYTMMTFWLSGCSSCNNSAPIASVYKGYKNQIISNPIYHDRREQCSKECCIANNSGHHKLSKKLYSNSFYTVKRGDTLFHIACISGNNLHSLAERNKIAKPYTLYCGQIIQLDFDSKQGKELFIQDRAHSALAHQSIRQIQGNGITDHLSQQFSYDLGKNNILPILPPYHAHSSSISSVTPTDIPANHLSNSSSIRDWHWITNGKIIDTFSSAEGGNKGIDIAGFLGQIIVAAAEGRVVYAGNALTGYGNLIIIKHNNDYLSAYAHNDTILVREQQEVKAGEKIATMGSTGTNSVRLHFEIRYKGKSVNPLNYLPQRESTQK